MAVDVLTELTIGRPIDVVAGFSADPSNAPVWYANIDSVAWKTPQPLRVGSQVEFTARFIRRRLVYTYEIVELIPGHRLVMATAEGPFPMETTYTWTPVGDDATLMTLRNRGEPTGFAKLLGPFMGAAIRRATSKDLVRLRATLER